MEAVISGQAGVALLLDGSNLSSIHVDEPERIIPRRAGEFHYLFGAASDVVFREDVSIASVRHELQVAVDGADVVHLFLILMSGDRPAPIRATAAAELGEVLTANPTAGEFAQRLLLAEPLPSESDIDGALRISRGSVAHAFLRRLLDLQPEVRIVREAWTQIPEGLFSDRPGNRRSEMEAVFVREGIVRNLVLAAANQAMTEHEIDAAQHSPAVQSLDRVDEILWTWRFGIHVSHSIHESTNTETPINPCVTSAPYEFLIQLDSDQFTSVPKEKLEEICRLLSNIGVRTLETS